MVAHKPEEVIEMDVAQLESLVARIERGTLEREDLQTLRAVLESYFYVTQLIDKKSTTIARLRQLVFGATTEKTDSKQSPARRGGQGNVAGPFQQQFGAKPTFAICVGLPLGVALLAPRPALTALDRLVHWQVTREDPVRALPNLGHTLALRPGTRIAPRDTKSIAKPQLRNRAPWQPPFLVRLSGNTVTWPWFDA